MANSSMLPLQTQLDRMMAADRARMEAAKVKASLAKMTRCDAAMARQALDDAAMRDGMGSPAAMLVLALAGVL